MKRTLLLLMLGILCLPPFAGADDWSAAKSEFEGAFRPTKKASDRESAVVGVGFFDTRDAAKLLLTGVEKVDRLLGPMLERKAEVDEQMVRIVELRFFAGLSVQETANVLELSARSVEREWQAAKALLKRSIG